MIGERQVRQEALFYGLRLQDHVPADHLLHAIDRFVELNDISRQHEPFYNRVGRPSVDPELMTRMLLIGCCRGIRSEPRLCEELHLNLAYRWFCRLGLDGRVPDLGGGSGCPAWLPHEPAQPCSDRRGCSCLPPFVLRDRLLCQVDGATLGVAVGDLAALATDRLCQPLRAGCPV